MTVCKCGQEASRVEVRVVQRCTNGHFVTSGAAPAILQTSPISSPQTPGQQRAFHAKANAVDELYDQKLGTRKREILTEHGFTSSLDADSLGMTRMLDELELQLGETG